MTLISPLENIHKKGFFGNYENKSNLIKIKEIKNLAIFQIVQYKHSLIQVNDINFESIKISNEPLKVTNNEEIRILWCGPKNWLLVSKIKNIKDNIYKIFNKNDFAVTDLSHSRAIIELDGNYSKEILKKGCPYNFNELKKDICINSVFNGINITIDMVDDNPEKLRLFTLRSFGESLYHSITDASLEFGYEAV